MRFLAIGTLALAAVFAFIPSLHAAPCESLGGLSLANTKIALAQLVPAGDFKIPGAPPNARPLSELPAFCRVAADITAAPDSDIKIEVWLPVTSWNGKFQAVGNGGWQADCLTEAQVDAARKIYLGSKPSFRKSQFGFLNKRYLKYEADNRRFGAVCEVPHCHSLPASRPGNTCFPVRGFFAGAMA